MKWHEIFKAGKYLQGSFTEKDIDNMIELFCEQKSSGIPLTFEHVKGAAFGWVDGLKRVGKSLYATLKDVNSIAKSAIEKKFYKNPSVEIQPNWRGRGPRLKALSVLGATPNEIKDLPELNLFEEEEEPGIILNFNEMEDNMDELEKLKKENAELKSQLDEKAKEFSEKESSFNKQITDLQASVEEQKQKAKEQEVHAFCEKLQQEGKIGGKEYFAREKQMLMTMDDTKTLEFADADGKLEKLTQFESYKKSLESRPRAFAEGEVINDKARKQYDYSDDDESDPESAKLFAEAKKLSSEKDITIAEACKIVSTKDGR